MSVYIKKTIASVQTDISSLIDWTSVNYVGVLTKEISTLQFNVKLTPNKTPLVIGTQIDMYESQGLTDSYSETNTDATAFMPSFLGIQYTDLGQIFTAAVSGRVTSCVFYLKKQGTPTGTNNMIAKLYMISGGLPSGAALASSTPLTANNLTTSFALTTFTFPTPYSVTAGVSYAIILEYATGGASTNNVGMGVDTSSPTALGTAVYSTNSGSSWTVNSTFDVTFYVYVNNGGPSVHTFGGTITGIETAVNGGGGIGIVQEVTCTDWSFSLNSRLVARNYTNADAATIVADIVASFAPAGYDASTYVVTGMTVPSISFNYEQVTQSIEKVAKQIGWQWYVDPDKKLHFFPAGSPYPAPFSINDTDGNLEWPSLDIAEDITNMKNSVVVIGGNYNLTTTSGNTPDIYKTDGVRATYQIVYPYSGTTIAVTLDGVAQTVGLSENNPNPASYNVIYNKAQQFIQFTSVPTTGKTVNVSGTASLPIIATSSNQTAINTYGLIQDSIIDKTIKSQEEAQQRADADIAMYGSPVYSVKFYTLRTGLIVGQMLSINSTIFGINISVTINRITGMGYSPNQLRYLVECTGTDVVSFIDILTVLLTSNNTNNPSPDSSTVENVFIFSESVTIADTVLTPTATAAPYVYGPDSGNVGLYNLSTFS